MPYPRCGCVYYGHVTAGRAPFFYPWSARGRDSLCDTLARFSLPFAAEPFRLVHRLVPRRSRRPVVPVLRPFSWPSEVSTTRGGVHPKVVQERLVHSRISVTLDTYSPPSRPCKPMLRRRSQPSSTRGVDDGSDCARCSARCATTQGHGFGASRTSMAKNTDVNRAGDGRQKERTTTSSNTQRRSELDHRSQGG